MKVQKWKAYYPCDGETAEDARAVEGAAIWDANSAAQAACKYDYSERDGWERADRPFDIVVIAPDGTETAFTGAHEPDIHHAVYEKSS